MPNTSRFQLILAAALLVLGACSHASDTPIDVPAPLFHSPAEVAQAVDQLLGKGEFEAALSLSERRLAEVRGQFGPEARETAYALANVAKSLAALERAEAAEAAYLDVVAIFAKIPDLDLRSQLAQSGAWHALAQLYEESGRPRQSIEARLEELKLLDTTGSDAYSAVLIWMQVGGIYLDLGELKAAENAYLEGVKAVEFVPRKNRWLPLFVYRHLAYLYRFEERYSRSEAVLEDGLTQMLAIYGQDNEYTVLFYEALGWTYFYQHRYDQAHLMADAALRSYRQMGLAEDGVRAMTLKARLLTEPAYKKPSYRSKQALALLTSALEIQASETGDDSQAYANVLSDLAHYHLTQHAFEKAENLSRKAMQIYEQTAGGAALALARSNQFLAEALQGQERHADALPYAQSAYTIQQAKLPPYHHVLGETLSLLSELYKALGQQTNYGEARQRIAAHYEARRSS